MIEVSKPVQNKSDNQGQTIVINEKQNETNGIGTAGFILSLIALFFGWIPILGWLIWIVGLILSFVGVFKKPKGLAIAGLIISFLAFIILILIFVGLAFLGSVS